MSNPEPHTNQPSSTRWLELVVVVALWALVALPYLGGAHLWDIDEGNNTEASREMSASNNWVVPTFNYGLRVDKPALLNWLQIMATHIVGNGELAARLPSALAALITLVATWFLGRTWLGRSGGLMAATVLATSPLFIASARFANPDSLLTALVTATVACHALANRGGGGSWMIPAALFSGLAMLGKGPVGLALPGAIVVAHLAWEQRLYTLWNRWLGAGIALWLAVAAPWYLWVGAETKYAWLRGFFFEHNVGRFTSPMEGHGGPFWYYLPVLLAGLFPWTFFLLPAGNLLVRGAASARPDLTRLFICWFVIPVGLFSISSTKLPNYVLPCYPAAALLLAGGLIAWARGEIKISNKWMASGFVGVALTGLTVIAGFLIAGGTLGPIGKFKPFPGIEQWAWVGLAPILGAIIALWTWRKSRNNALLALGFTATLFTGLLGAWNGRTFNRYKAAEALAGALPADHLKHEVRLGAYDWFQPSLVFYAQRRVDRLGGSTEARLFLEQPLPAYLAISARAWDELRPSVPRAQEMARRYDMYRRTDVVLVANPAAQQLNQRPENAEAGTVSTVATPGLAAASNDSGTR